MYYRIFRVKFTKEFDYCGIVWNEKNNVPKIKRIFLPNSGEMIRNEIIQQFEHTRSWVNRDTERIILDIRDYFKSEVVKFSFKFLDTKECSSFQLKVLRAEFSIPRGQIRSYNWVARQIGIKSRGSQAVGQALAHNPFPIIIPCHRVIRKDGNINGFQRHKKLKKKMLELEGVSFASEWKVDIRKLKDFS